MRRAFIKLRRCLMGPEVSWLGDLWGAMLKLDEGAFSWSVCYCRLLYVPLCSVQDVNYFVPMPGAKSKGLLGKGQELQLLKVGIPAFFVSWKTSAQKQHQGHTEVPPMHCCKFPLQGLSTLLVLLQAVKWPTKLRGFPLLQNISGVFRPRVLTALMVSFAPAVLLWQFCFGNFALHLLIILKQHKSPAAHIVGCTVAGSLRSWEDHSVSTELTSAWLCSIGSFKVAFSAQSMPCWQYLKAKS